MDKGGTTEEFYGITGLVVAAGMSVRMGEFKPLLPLGGETVITKTVGSLIKAGVRDVRVVAGHRAGELLPVLEPLGVRVIVNDHYREGMFTSVLAGIRTLEPGVGGFFLLPADYPLIRPRTIRQLAEAYRKSGAGIVHPRYAGRRGHPPLISARFIPAILAWDQPGGLRAALAPFERDGLEIDVDDPGVRLDLDTPQDYRAAVEYCRQQGAGLSTATDGKTFPEKTILQEVAHGQTCSVRPLQHQELPVLDPGEPV